MAQVRFNLRSNVNKDSSIQFIYRLEGDNKKVVIATGLHTLEKHWNPNKMRFRSNAPDSIKKNVILDKWESKANEVIFESQTTQLSHSTTSFKEALLYKWSSTTRSKSSNNILQYFKEFITLKEKTSVRPSTIKQYNNALNHLSHFIRIKKNNSKIEFQDCNETFFVDFVKYLRDVEDLEDNTINKILKRITSVFNHATANGVNKLLEYKSDNCKVRYTKQPKFYLSEGEIAQIVKLKLAKGSKLYNVRAMFLVGYNTGQRFSDFSTFKKEHITTTHGNKIIIKKSVKVGHYIKVPVNRELESILDEYDGFPEFISEQKFNDYLKELCKKAKINEMVAKNVKGKQEMFPKHELVASHVCRRSFATNMYKMNPDLLSIMKITGHTSISQLQTYLCIDEAESIELVSSHRFFNR